MKYFSIIRLSIDKMPKINYNDVVYHLLIDLSKHEDFVGLPAGKAIKKLELRPLLLHQLLKKQQMRLEKRSNGRSRRK
jgi:hypothetical protein